MAIERGLAIRRASAADIPDLLDLDRQSARSAHWSQEQYRKLFSEDPAHTTGRLILLAELAEAPTKPATGIFPDSTAKIEACLVAKKVDTEWELENIVVAEKWRRQGLGKKLLQAFITQVEEAGGEFIFLEVRESNRGAQSLYQRFGFEMTGRRKDYYPNPVEDAILYRRVVKKP